MNAVHIVFHYLMVIANPYTGVWHRPTASAAAILFILLPKGEPLP